MNYKIIETVAANATCKWTRNHYSHQPDKRIFEVWKMEKTKFLRFKSEEWVYEECYYSLNDAKDKILYLKGSHPSQLRRKAAKKIPSIVVYEE